MDSHDRPSSLRGDPDLRSSSSLYTSAYDEELIATAVSANVCNNDVVVMSNVVALSMHLGTLCIALPNALSDDGARTLWACVGW